MPAPAGCGRLSSLAPVSLLAALVSSTILLRSGGRILLCGMETRGISKLTSVNKFSNPFVSPCKLLPRPSCTQRGFKWHHPPFVVFPPNLVAILAAYQVSLPHTTYKVLKALNYVLVTVSIALRIFAHLIVTTNL